MQKSILLFSLIFFIHGNCQINNLIHTDDYPTSQYGSLGKVEKFGNGPKDMILLAGWGFDVRVFENIKSVSMMEKYTMYAVTLPGFGGTQAYSMPNTGEGYSKLNWTNGIILGLKELVKKENLENPVLLSYFTYSNILAMRMALDYPELIDRVIIVSGMAKFTAMNPSFEPANLNNRIYYTEKVVANSWFKEMDKKGWDNGNFTPDTFSKDSVIAAQYWKQMSEIPIPVMVRYLLEYYCTDLSLEYHKVKIPILVVLPSFTREALVKPENLFLPIFFHHSWWGANPSNSNFHLMTVMDSHAFILDDQPEKLIDIINTFVAGELNRYDVQR